VDQVTGRIPPIPAHGRHYLCSAKGFTLVELMVVIALIAALLSIAAPQFAAYLEQGRKAKCLSNRYNIEQDERAFYLNTNNQSLVIDNRYRCPSGGVYVWMVADPTDPNYPRIGCSLHYAPVSPSLTSLGSTFTEITTSMISLISNFYKLNNRYPRSWGDYVFTDLGLDPKEWEQSFNGLYYSPGGTKVTIGPADGYTVTMMNLQGASLTMNPKWNLIYDMLTGQWYYHTIAPPNLVDIRTLQVIKK
jgi:prepilin-type N-terminal cleavage/methylation domain-containing protein